MAENKEITTLHPYLNRNKNRYPNVKDENIPDTIQRKMTAGTGINISPDNVISATGGDSYTRSETDALLETKADKTALNNAEKVIPTDIAVKNGKIGLEHDATWLTNQNAITLGDGLTYDETTKTLKASGGGGGETIHFYSVTINSENDRFYYIASSATDYGRDNIFVLDFATNKTYADLRKVGKTYALSGYCYSGEQMCQAIELSIIDLANYPFQINIFNPATKETELIIKGQVAARILKIS